LIAPAITVRTALWRAGFRRPADLLICPIFFLESDPQMVRKIGGIRYHRVVIARQINHLKIGAYPQPSFSIIWEIFSLIRWREINDTYRQGHREVVRICKLQCIFHKHGVSACNPPEWCLPNGWFGSLIHGARAAGPKSSKSSITGGNDK